MRLPRRVPWRALTELQELCTWIYNSNDDLNPKINARNRLVAWQIATVLPQGLEAVLLLMTAIIEDKTLSSSDSYCPLAVRQSYSTALIRMVNGVVDPMQSGVYARSIASIASQIGLPAWLVELRHAATHEDLPSLELLRDGALQALTWLYHNFFIPILEPSQHHVTSYTLPSLKPWLKLYKTLAGRLAQDESLRPRNNQELSKQFRELEKWIACVKVELETRYPISGTEHQGDSSEIEAMSELCSASLRKGILIPRLEKHDLRIAAENTTIPIGLEVWDPLMQYLQAHHKKFAAVFFRSCIDCIGNGSDPTYQNIIASWATWLLLQDNVVLQSTELQSILSGVVQQYQGSSKVMATVLEAIVSRYPDMGIFVAAITSSQCESTWSHELLQCMEDRLGLLRASDRSSPTHELSAQSETYKLPNTIGDHGTEEGLRGWRKLSREILNTRPIGV